MRAFRELLHKHPETHQRATLIQIASPSREDVSAYTDILHELESLCGSINGNYGDLEWMPVRYIHRCDVLQPAPQQLRIEVRAARQPGVQWCCCRAFLTCVRNTLSRS